MQQKVQLLILMMIGVLVYLFGNVLFVEFSQQCSLNICFSFWKFFFFATACVSHIKAFQGWGVVGLGVIGEQIMVFLASSSCPPNFCFICSSPQWTDSLLVQDIVRACSSSHGRILTPGTGVGCSPSLSLWAESKQTLLAECCVMWWWSLGGALMYLIQLWAPLGSGGGEGVGWSAWGSATKTWATTGKPMGQAKRYPAYLVHYSTRPQRH